MSRSYRLEEIATLTGTRLIGAPDQVITSVADLESATEHDASFLANFRYTQAMIQSKAGVIFIDEKTETPPGKNVLVSANPSASFQQLVDLFYQDKRIKSGFQGIHPTAVIHPSALIGKEVNIGPYVVIDQKASIGDRTTISAHSSIGPGTSIGSDCLIHPHVTIREGCHIGNRVIIQPNAVIGSCGFGFLTNLKGHHDKLEQVGTVEIKDDVEIGAGTTIDRARFRATVIGRGTKIDNLVQIGHGVQVGEDNMIVAQSGIAGSTKTGRHVVLGGKAAIAGHIELADGVRIAGMAGVSKSLPKGDYNGIPAVPIAEYNRTAVLLRNIGKFAERLKHVEETLKILKS
jgi:UDP-3-O-[3-hydroxymyristoyl] glucosamine N-acyltransferase